MERRWKRVFWWTLGLTGLVKVALAAAVPITNDEAYFALWGRFPDWGFYDHPPMVGWLLNLMERLGHGALMVRLPSVLFSLAVGWLMWRLLRKDDEEKAALTAVFFLLSPINVLNVPITTDTPLFLFSFLSGLALYRAMRDDAPVFYLLAGLALGGAFLSKYFSALLALAYAVVWLRSPKSWKRTAGFLLLFAATIPALLLMGWWNYHHGWPNLMFNLINRNQGEVFEFGKPLGFLLIQAYFLTPPALYVLWRRRAQAGSAFLRGPRSIFFTLFLVPILAFALLSMKKSIGVHWVLSFYPFWYLALFGFLDAVELRKCARFMAWFSFAQVALVALVLALPFSVWKGEKTRRSVVTFTQPQALREALRPYEASCVLATPSYADSALLEYHFRTRVIVFGPASFHARHDDLRTDFRAYEGRDMLILLNNRLNLAEYSPYFRSVELKSVEAGGAAFPVLLGHGFDYGAYREGVLRPIRDRYYRIPPWLPYRSCDFLDKYFPEGR